VPLKPPPRTLAVLPVKSFGAAKQRLSGELRTGARQALAQAMFSDVLGALRHVQGIEAIVVVTGDRAAESAAFGERVQVLRDEEESGQSQAALIGVRWGLAHGFERALLVPGDTPLVQPGEVQDLLDIGEEQRLDAVIVPDRHGTGTNALLLSPPDVMEPSFGPSSLDRHVASASGAGLTYTVERLPSFALDVDTPDDLAELAERLGGRRGQAPMTRGALVQIDRLRMPRPVAPAPAQV
jgi:2-phospho-L-lactate/phosphoenolpyruvate guanylyltransferase